MPRAGVRQPAWPNELMSRYWLERKQGERMSRLLVRSFSISLDGFGAGPRQDLEHPLGMNGEQLMEWVFPTQFFQRMHNSLGDAASGGGETGVDNDMASKGIENLGAWILGRNMFGPVRGPWPDDSWKGWWGDEPPYHCPVFVLTHHTREPLEMKGGTTFYFITGGLEEALAHAKLVAAGRDIRLGGGVATVRQGLKARLIDELHLAQRHVLLGEGECLFSGIDLRALGYECYKSVAGERATHQFIRRRP